MRIHWRLAPNDFERAAASFPVNGGRPVAVVSLRRGRTEGGTELADEASLGPGVCAGAGERRVQIPLDHGLYHAELGLMNGEGGWLMLARSNSLYNAAGIGVRWGGPRPARFAGRPLPVAAAETGGVPSMGLGRTTDAKPGAGSIAEPALGGADLPAGPREFPLVSWDETPSLVSHSGGQGTNRVQGPPREALDPDRPAATHRVPLPGGLARESGHPGGLGVRPDSVAASPANLGDQPPGPGSEGPGSPGPLTPRLGVSIEPFGYGDGIQRVDGVELEAELRILGRASPGRVIDLFGFRYQVGPGGRFKLTLAVTDPELLRRALLAAPPAELPQPRDD